MKIKKLSKLRLNFDTLKALYKKRKKKIFLFMILINLPYNKRGRVWVSFHILSIQSRKKRKHKKKEEVDLKYKACSQTVYLKKK